MSRRSLLLPAVLCALALPAAPALAGEDPGTPPPPTTPGPVSVSGTATLHASQGCVLGKRTRLAVSGTAIASVAFYVSGKHVKTVTTPNSSGRYALTMRCSRLTVGAHRGRAVVTFQAGSSPAHKTLRFQITRGRQSSPQFTG